MSARPIPLGSNTRMGITIRTAAPAHRNTAPENSGLTMKNC